MVVPYPNDSERRSGAYSEAYVLPVAEPAEARSCALPVGVHVTAGLPFYTSGIFRSVVGDVGHLSQGSGSRIVERLSQIVVLTSGEVTCFHTVPRVEALTSVDGHHGLSILKRVVTPVNLKCPRVFLALRHTR